MHLNRFPMLGNHFFLLQRATFIIFLFLQMIFSISFEKEEKAVHCRSLCSFPDLGIMPDDWVAIQAVPAAKRLTAFVAEE